VTRLAFPFRVAADGRIATVADGSDAHLRDMLVLLVTTVTGERVMRPEFGSPVTQLLFAAGNGAVAAALQATLEAAIRQWLGHLLTVDDLTARFDEATAVLDVTITYEVLRTKRTDSVTVTRPTP
jgi:phage baseplate assembly protein W